MLDLRQFQWTRQPKSFSFLNEGLEVITAPHTDLWQRTYYHFRNDNAPVFQMETEEPFFSFQVKTTFESKHRFDQCGVVMYLDSENWLKGSLSTKTRPSSTWAAWPRTMATPIGPPPPSTLPFAPCGTGSAGGRTISASSAPPTGSISARCGCAICGRPRGGSALGSTLAVRRIPPSGRCLPTWS